LTKNNLFFEKSCILIWEGFKSAAFSAMDTRRSSQSSGFESARSAALHLVSTDWSNVELVYDTLTKEDLVELIKEQRVRLAQKERRVRDLEEYVDSLLARVMETRPDLLHAAPLHPPQRIRL
jgi:hypothetical protein